MQRQHKLPADEIVPICQNNDKLIAADTVYRAVLENVADH